MSPESALGHQALFPPSEEVQISVEAATNLIEQLGLTPVQLDSGTYLLEDGRIRLILGDPATNQLIGAYNLKPEKIIPPTHYPITPENDSGQAPNGRDLSHLIASRYTENPEFRFDELKRKCESELKSVELNMGFFASADNRLHALISTKDAPEILQGVFSINIDKTVSPRDLLSIIEKTVFESNPYNDGVHP